MSYPQVMTSVVDLISLGLQMLVIAGIRVVFAINAKYGSLEQMHTLPPNVLFWLKSLVSYNLFHIIIKNKVSYKFKANYLKLIKILFSLDLKQ
jgi:hypothetical protein